MTTNEDVRADQIAAADAYESLFVPALFAPWAAIVAGEADVRSGDRVLDVGCGTGALAREIAVGTGDQRTVTGIDASGGMLAVARRRTPAITWRQTPAEALPFADRAFDVVVSQFALMFFANPLAALREMRRVLAESGRVAVAVWNRIERAPAYAAEADLFERSAGRPAADAVRVPFALGDEQRLIQLFEDGGFSPIEIVSHTCVARFPSIRSMVEADLRGWLPVMDVHLDERVIRRVLDEAEPALREFVAADGTVVFDTNALIVRFALPPRTRQS